jgi:uncharacterized protein YuzE
MCCKTLFDVTYDEDTDSLYLYLTGNIRNGDAVQQLFVADTPEGSEIILDFNEHGKLLGVEMLGASACVSEDLLKVARPPGLSASGA